MIRLPENTQLYIKSKELENRPISIAEYIACHIDDFFSMAAAIFANNVTFACEGCTTYHKSDIRKYVITCLILLRKRFLFS